MFVEEEWLMNEVSGILEESVKVTSKTGFWPFLVFLEVQNLNVSWYSKGSEEAD
jgi:hypothetical protein